MEEGEEDFTAPEEHDFDGRAFNRVIYGNAQDNTIIGSEGKSSEIASSESYASDDIRAGAGDDYVDAKSGEDWVYGQAGDDTLKGGSDHDIDHLFGGEGDDKPMVTSTMPLVKREMTFLFAKMAPASTMVV